MSGVLRDYESIDWFLFRYTNLKAMPYSELGTHEVGGAANRQLQHESLRLKGIISAGKNSLGQGRAHAQFSRLWRRGTQQGAPALHGPREFTQLPDFPFMRACLYVNLVAALADLPQEDTCLFLWLPQTVREYTDHVNQGRKFPVRNLDTSPEQRGTAMIPVEYNRPLMDKWIAYAQRHPDYCMGEAWQHKIIDYTT